MSTYKRYFDSQKRYACEKTKFIFFSNQNPIKNLTMMIKLDSLQLDINPSGGKMRRIECPGNFL